MSHTEPCRASCALSTTTGPELVPLLTSEPRTCRLPSEAISVSCPTESKTTGTPRPPVSSRTRRGISAAICSGVRPPVTMTCAQPCARATSALASVLTVPIIVTPRARAHWQATRPTPPAAAWYRMVSPPCRGNTCRNRYCAVRPFIISVAALRSLMPSGSGISTSAGITRTSL